MDNNGDDDENDDDDQDNDQDDNQYTDQGDDDGDNDHDSDGIDPNLSRCGANEKIARYVFHFHFFLPFQKHYSIDS